MEANNQYNFGGHPSVPANSGLKPSSGESLHTNGSSMSFSQQGKNINGDLNVNLNGVTTVAGTSVAGLHPPTSYSHMSGLHQHHGSLGYDYLWGRPQFSPATSAGQGVAMHQKQGTASALQQHFQGHAQYQANGGLMGSRQASVTAPPNVTLTGGQYWNRSSPTQQHVGSSMAAGYSPHGGYGAYQGQAHASVAPAQHHRQQLHPQAQLHHHQQQQHPQQQQQQQQQHHHYGMVPNGMSYYQFQAPPQSQAPPHPQAFPLSQAPPQSQAALQSQALIHSQALTRSQAPPQSQALTHSQASPRSQSSSHPQAPQHSQALSQAQTSPHSLTPPLSQTPSQSQTLPLPKALSHCQTPPLSQTPTHSQSLPLLQASPRSQALSHSQTPPLSQASPHPQTPPQSQAPASAQFTPSTQIMPPTSQSFTPPRHSPQHHSVSRMAGSPLPRQASPLPVMPPSSSPLPMQASPLPIKPFSMRENGALAQDGPFGRSGSQAAGSQGSLNELHDSMGSHYGRVETAAASLQPSQVEAFSHRLPTFTAGLQGDFSQRSQLFPTDLGHLTPRRYKEEGALGDFGPATVPRSSAPAIPSAASAPSVAPAASTVSAPSVAPAASTVSAPSVAPAASTVSAPSVAPAVHTVSAPSVAPAASTVSAPSVAPAVHTVSAPSVAPAASTVSAPSVAPAVHTVSAPSVAPAASTVSAPSVAPAVHTVYAPSVAPAFSAFSAPSVAPAFHTVSAPSVAPARPKISAPSVVAAIPEVSAPSVAPAVHTVSAPSVAPAPPKISAPSVVAAIPEVSAPSVAPFPPKVCTPTVVSAIPTISAPSVGPAPPKISAPTVVSAIPTISAPSVTPATPVVSASSVAPVIPSVSSPSAAPATLKVPVPSVAPAPSTISGPSVAPAPSTISVSAVAPAILNVSAPCGAPGPSKVSAPSVAPAPPTVHTPATAVSASAIDASPAFVPAPSTAPVPPIGLLSPVPEAVPVPVSRSAPVLTTALPVSPVPPLVPARPAPSKFPAPPRGSVSPVVRAPAAPALSAAVAPPAFSTPVNSVPVSAPPPLVSVDTKFGMSRAVPPMQAPPTEPALSQGAVCFSPREKEADAVTVDRREGPLIGGLSSAKSEASGCGGEPQSIEPRPPAQGDEPSRVAQPPSTDVGAQKANTLDVMVGTPSAAESSLADESWVTEDSEEAEETQNEDLSDKEEAAEMSSVLEDSRQSSLLNESLNKPSQSDASVSCASDSSRSSHSTVEDSSEALDLGRDAPDSVRGYWVRLHDEDLPVKRTAPKKTEPLSCTNVPKAGSPPKMTPKTQASPSQVPQKSSAPRGVSTATKGWVRSTEVKGAGGRKRSAAAADSSEGKGTASKSPLSQRGSSPGPSSLSSAVPQKPRKRARKEEKAPKEGKRAKNEELVVKKGAVKGTAKEISKGATKGPGKGSPKTPKAPKVEAPAPEEEDEDEEDASANGEVQRRRIATEEQVKFPLLNGWKREVRVRRCENRLKGETWYYSPCGKRMKQFPEVIKYLSRHPITAVTREHFSFSPRMPVGDFYEERDTPKGVEWCLLADEEVPSIIMAITGKRGRPPNPDKVRPRARSRAGTARSRKGSARRPGRPPKVKMADLLLKTLAGQETLSDEQKEKLMKMMKKMRKKARNKKKEESKSKKGRQVKRKPKVEKTKETKEQEVKAAPPEPSAPKPAPEPKKPQQRRRKKAKPDEEEEEKKPEVVKRAGGARSKAKALAKAKAEAEAQALAAAAAKRQAERRAQAQRRLQERKRQQLLLEELKKPTEDMCITDHKDLPVFSRLPGLVLSGPAFLHCLTVMEFLHSYGKVVGLQIPRDVPSLASLQEGLLGLGDSQAELQDLLVKLVQAALRDPGLPPYYQSVKILGEKLADLELNRSSVSEALRIFLEARGFQAEVCNSLRSKPFQALSPDAKAAALGFLVDELNSSNIVINEIDTTLENMAIYRKNKWGIEGKLRRLKVALARRTGRSEAQLCMEERRRSARVAEEENLSLEESITLERGSRRGRRDEPKLSEGESPTTASIPELERQIDKLSKRQVFFRKKLLQCSHNMRALSLGQDRYRRRYWVLPHLGAVLVEGAEEILASGDVLVKEEEEPQPPVEPPISPVKAEPESGPDLAVSPPAPPAAAPPTPPAAAPPPQEEDPLPGTASLMSSPRGRGRPRKIKPEVELHLRTAKNRRRRRSSKASAEESAPPGPASQNGYDTTQSAFLAWLSQSQGLALGSASDGLPGACSQDGDSMKEMAEKQGQWFNLLPKMPCDGSSLSQSPVPNAVISKDLASSPGLLPAFTVSPLQLPQSCLLFSALDPQMFTPFQKPGSRRRRASDPFLTPTDPSALGYSIPGTKRRGRPPSKLLMEIEQKYFTQLIPRPIPTWLVRGWWWIRQPEEVSALVEALHPRGIREKTLHKHLSKHSEYLAEVCGNTISDPVFQERAEPDPVLAQASQEPWVESRKAMEADVKVLQWVEDLEQRVLMADLQQNMVPQMERDDDSCSSETAASEPQGFALPEPDSTRTDLEYHEHVVEPQDDWIVKTKKEWSGFLRLPNNPLDLAVMRLAALECNIERRYLKEPLWNLAEVVRLAPLTPPPGDQPPELESVESEITPRLRLWRQALDRCRSSSQLSLCLLQLERSIAWERSVIRVTCLVCRKGDNDEYLLLCDGCDRGCHMYCLRPKISQIPDGDWFCPVCEPKENGDSQRPRRTPKRKSCMQKRRPGGYGSGSSDEEPSPRRERGMATRQRDGSAPSHLRFSGEAASSTFSPAKRRRMATRNQPDLTFCEIILMEMEAHADAWPFLEPVNPRLVPGYRRIIKHPMDFLTMRERLLQGGYCSCEEFAADAQLVFDNCQLFNEDTSEVGIAGHAMRRFFESRWAEFYQEKDQ